MKGSSNYFIHYWDIPMKILPNTYDQNFRVKQDNDSRICLQFSLWKNGCISSMYILKVLDKIEYNSY